MVIYDGMRDAKQLWRWTGGLALAGAVVMVILGETSLQGALKPVAFICYWGICILLTTYAILAANVDLRRIRGLARSQQRDLFESTLTAIQEESKEQKRSGDFRGLV